MEITTEYNSWYIILCAVLAGLYTFILYRKNARQNELAAWVINLLVGLRFLSVFIIAILLINPLLQKWVTQSDEPIIILAQDVSESILNNKDSAFYKTIYLEKIERLKQSISGNYKLVSLPFGADVLPGSAPILYSEKQTNYAKLFNEIDARYAGDNVGALIIASDGLFNVGANPSYYNFKQLYPVYTIGLGDTNDIGDISIAEILTNEIAYLGNKFPVNVGINTQLLKGKMATLTIAHKGKVVAKRNFEITSESDYSEQKFVFTADEVGAQRYTISVTEFDTELNLINNHSQVLIDVIDNRDKILILSDAPHPDIAAIRSVLSKKDNIELDVALIGDIDKVYSSYNLIISHGFGGAENSNIWNKVWEAKVPLWVIIDGKTGLSAINTFNSGFQLKGSAGKTNTINGVFNDGFSHFKLGKETHEFLNNCPPVFSPYGEINGYQKSQVLMYQKLGSLTTPYPLAYFGKRNDQKTGWFFGEGIWKWKMFDYQENGNTIQFEEFVGKFVQYLSVKEDKSRLRLNYNKRFSESQSVNFKADVYNKSYELINTEELKMEVTNEMGSKFNYVFGAMGASYRLDLGKLPAGVYDFESSVFSVGEKLTKKGSFIITPLTVEWQKVSADFNVLKKLSEKTKGKFFLVNELEQLEQEFQDTLKFPSISYTSETKKSILHEKWIFFLVLLLLTIEWVTRKYKGRY
ncbi:MAG: hypothetical protein ACJA2N_000084 [Salibacteraceae bacterium]|jgi:hypothetical protein